MFLRAFFCVLLISSAVFSGAKAQTGYVRFLKAIDTIPEWIPVSYYYVETYNPTTDTFRCVAAVVIDSTTATPVLDLNAGNRGIMVPPNTTQIDSFPIEVIDDHLYDPFERIVFRLVNLSDPSFLIPVEWSYVYILDDDLFSISFIGAARSIVEQDTVFLLRVALNGEVEGFTSARVSLDLSNATKGKDFDFKDTTITIAPFSFDTFYIPVFIYDDTIVEPNEQINFTLSNPTNGAIIDIAGFTLTIVDNDLPPSAVTDEDIFRPLVFPNPFTDVVNIRLNGESALFRIFNSLGEVVKEIQMQESSIKISTSELPSGVYFVEAVSEHGRFVKTMVKNY